MTSSSREATVLARRTAAAPSERPLAQSALAPEIADDVDVIRAMVAEFFGTMFLLFFGLGVVYASAVTTFDMVKTERVMMMCVAYGFAYGACVYGFSFPSSDFRVLPNTRHLNPAITTSLYLAKKISLTNTLLYMLSQVAGGGIGVLLIFYLTPLDKQDVVSVYPSVENITKSNEWTMEFITSFIMTLVVLFTNFGHLATRTHVMEISSGEESPQTHHELNCIISGFIITVCNALGSGVSGGYMNPLFAMGISILSAVSKPSAYVAPFLGGGFAVLVGLAFGYNAPFSHNTGIVAHRYTKLSTTGNNH